MSALDAFALGLITGALLWPLGLLLAWALLRRQVGRALDRVAYALSTASAELSEEEAASLWLQDPSSWRLGQAAALLSMASPAAQHAVIGLLSGVVLSESPDDYENWKRLSGLAREPALEISKARAAAESAFTAWVLERTVEEQARTGGFE